MSNVVPAAQDYDTFNTIDWAWSVAFPGLDLTLYSAIAMTLRVTPNQPSAVLTLDLASGLSVTAPHTLAGAVPLTTTQGIKPGQYVYDVRGLRAGPVYDILQRGTIYVTDGVTR